MNDMTERRRQERNQKLEALQERAEALLEEATRKRKQYEQTVDLWAKVRDEVKLLQHENEIDAEVQRRLMAQKEYA